MNERILPAKQYHGTVATVSFLLMTAIPVFAQQSSAKVAFNVNDQSTESTSPVTDSGARPAINKSTSVKTENTARTVAVKKVAIAKTTKTQKDTSPPSMTASNEGISKTAATKENTAESITTTKNSIGKSVTSSKDDSVKKATVKEPTAKTTTAPGIPGKNAAGKEKAPVKDSTEKSGLYKEGALKPATVKTPPLKPETKPAIAAKVIGAKTGTTVKDSMRKSIPVKKDSVKVPMVKVVPPQNGMAKATQVKAEVASQTITEDRYPQHTVTFPNGVVSIPDLTYATLPGFRPLTLDLYLPPDSQVPPVSGFPLVVYIHGGGWMAGHARHAGAFANFPQVLASLATQGYIVASVNYRLSGEAKSPAAVLDIKTAIRWLRSKATSYKINPMRIAIWGSSAGGQLAGLVAVTCGVKSFDPDQPPPDEGMDEEGHTTNGTLPPDIASQSDCVQAAVIWYGIFDFTTLRKQSTIKENQTTPGIQAAIHYLGCNRCPPGLAKGASSTLYIDKKDPPMLLIHGTSDKVVPYEQSEDMVEKLKQAGVDATLLPIDGVGHGFIGPMHQKTTAASLKALNATFEFFDKHIGSGENK